MNSFKLSDKTKIIIVICIAVFEIAFIQFNKDKPRIAETTSVSSEVIVNEHIGDNNGQAVGVEVIGNDNQQKTGEVLVEENASSQEIADGVNETDYLIENTSSDTEISSEDKRLDVHYLDVGQADAVYIGYGDFDMVIDGGNNEDGPFVVDYIKRQGVDTIELLVASHAHEDHIGGLDDVLEAFPVKTVIDSGEVKDTITYRDYMKSAKQTGATIINDDTRTFKIDPNMTVEIIEAVDDDKNTNNNSVIVKLTYKEVSFLFTGDLEKEIEEKILTKNIEATVFKAGHHGSSTSNSDMFIRRIKPEAVIISAGAGNKYGHPHSEALARLKKQTDQIFGTWENGSIIVHTDGINYQIDADEIVTMGDANASGGGSESDDYKETIEIPVDSWFKKVVKPAQNPIVDIKIEPIVIEIN